MRVVVTGARVVVLTGTVVVGPAVGKVGKVGKVGRAVVAGRVVVTGRAVVTTTGGK